MKLVLTEPRYLKDSISVISELVSEARFKVGKDGLEVVAIDPANVAMIVFKLLNSAFTEYNVKDKKDICINLESFNQILKRSKPSDVLTLELDEEKNCLNVYLKGENSRHFSLGLINSDEEEQKVPSLDFTAKVETNTLLFNEAIEDVGIISESVLLAANPKTLSVHTKGTINSGKVEIGEGPETKIDLKGGNAVEARYSLGYLKKIIKGGKLTTNMTLNFGKDYPLRVDYKVTDKLLLSTILAPRVSND